MAFPRTISRSEFLKTSALALSLPILSKLDATAAPLKNVGLQLYTVRNEMEKDVEGTLKKVAAIGYTEIEIGGYYGKSPKEFKAFLSGMGLSAPSLLTMTSTMKTDWQKTVDQAAEAGQSLIGCAYLAPNERKTIDDYKKLNELFNRSAEVCQKAGLQFIYHNHDFEFQPLDGQVPYDLLLKGTDPKLVKLELDIYWSTKAGQDPVALFKQNPGRFPIVHLKDMEKTAERSFAPVGTGSIDFQRILDARKIAGIKHYYVEQDICKVPPLEAIAISFQNVKKLNA
ncbi:sugar phosphate isomerase/epimerase family protein [Spirosoma foliorum]|uniref:Sugar phosphate isomerase/epimerase n=1 Tax=Spirosoma foliorum TaxID=2710596 RepID=A0A7G5GUZ8_9BACT|nr:sugar phosphate isomerase/epimerase [Spirosoma foliorum]QMW02690.1 sugar phosphate isomerase/epimerase [Spirosoma foliorum]